MNTDDTGSGFRRPAIGLIEAALWLALVISGLATAGLVWGGSAAAIELLQPQAGLWWRWTVLFYGVGGLAVGVVLAVLTRLVRTVRPGRTVARVSAIWVLFTVLWLNRGALARIVSAPAELGDSQVSLIAIVIACVFLAMLAIGVMWSRPWFVRLTALAAIGAFWVAFSNARVELSDQPLEFQAVSPTSNRPLLVIGLDGADWDFLELLMARGDLPHLEQLRSRGVWGELETIRPTRSAPIWTSVVTGVEADRHGVINNSVERLRGSFHRLPHTLPRPTGLGFGYLEELLRRQGQIAQSTVASFDRKVPAFWTVATVNDSPVDVVNWWATWPAEEIFGRLVSDRIHFWRLAAKGFAHRNEHVTYPETLHDDLSRLVMRPDQVTRQHALGFMEVDEREFEEMKTMPYRHHRLKSEFKYLYSMYLSNLKIAMALVESGRRAGGPVPDLFVLFRIIDQASHQALQYSELVDDHLGSSADEVAKYGRVVSEAYRAADRAVGMLVESFGPANVVILSDHGFALAKKRNRGRLYDHLGSNPPDGMFIATGEGFRSGRVDGVGIYDMMPLFLYLKGWPVADDFVAEVPTELFSDEHLRNRPVRTIDTYGTMQVRLPEQGSLVADDEMIERLRALGYID